MNLFLIGHHLGIHLCGQVIFPDLIPAHIPGGGGIRKSANGAKLLAKTLLPGNHICQTHSLRNLQHGLYILQGIRPRLIGHHQLNRVHLLQPVSLSINDQPKLLRYGKDTDVKATAAFSLPGRDVLEVTVLPFMEDLPLLILHHRHRKLISLCPCHEGQSRLKLINMFVSLCVDIDARIHDFLIGHRFHGKLPGHDAAACQPKGLCLHPAMNPNQNRAGQISLSDRRDLDLSVLHDGLQDPILD